MYYSKESKCYDEDHEKQWEPEGNWGGCMGNGCEEGTEPKCGQGPSCGSETMSGNGQVPGSASSCIRPGKTHNNYYKVDGKKANVVTKDYYNNYYTRYNHIFVKNLKVVKDYVYDCNIVHYCSDVVYEGSKYLGSSCYEEEDCCCRPRPRC